MSDHQRSFSVLSASNSNLYSICIASVILVIVCFRLDQTSLDVTWTLVPVELWAAVEAHLAIVSGERLIYPLPTLQSSNVLP